MDTALCFFTVEGEARILRACKFGFSMTDLAACFNENEGTIYRIICRRSLTKRLMETRSPSSRKMRTVWKIHVCNKTNDLSNLSKPFLRRRMKKFKLLQVSLDIRQALNKRYRKARASFSQEFKSSCFLLEVGFLLMSVCSVINLDQFTEKSFVKRTFQESLSHRSKMSRIY